MIESRILQRPKGSGQHKKKAYAHDGQPPPPNHRCYSAAVNNGVRSEGAAAIGCEGAPEAQARGIVAVESLSIAETKLAD